MASAAAIDRALDRTRRAAQFHGRDSLLWLMPWALLLAVGMYAAGLCLYYGLNQTNMDNRFAVRSVDLSGPHGHRAGRRSVFHRLSGLHPEAQRAEAGASTAPW